MVNVFVSSYSPRKSAQAQPDLLTQRMCNEAAEILCGVHWNLQLGLEEQTPTAVNELARLDVPPYKRTLGQRKHPIVLWAGEDRQHARWLLSHMHWLAEEYRHRYPDNNRYPKSYMRCYTWLSERLELVPSGLYPTSVRPSQMHYYGAFNEKELAEETQRLFGRDIRHSYRTCLLHKWLYEYQRKHKWSGPAGLPMWASDKRYRKLLHEMYGEPKNKLG